jgi:hypothetical protein
MTEAPSRLVELVEVADKLRRQEFARLSEAVTPRIEAFQSMTADAFRNEIAAMLERLGHEVISSVSDLVTTKGGRKYITACADPLERTPTNSSALRRLHDSVVSAGAAKGFYVTPRQSTPEAEHYAAGAPIDLIDGELLIKSMHRSRKGVSLQPAYKALCCQCGEIVTHHLDKNEALPCRNGHLVAPTIARAALIPLRRDTSQQPIAPAAKAKPPRVIRPRNMIRQAVGQSRPSTVTDVRSPARNDSCGHSLPAENINLNPQ